MVASFGILHRESSMDIQVDVEPRVLACQNCGPYPGPHDYTALGYTKAPISLTTFHAAPC